VTVFLTDDGCTCLFYGVRLNLI